MLRSKICRGACAKRLICLATGDYEPASEAFEEALAYVRTTSDPANLAFVLSKLGATRMMMGDLDRAWTLRGEAHALVEPMARGIASTKRRRDI